MAEQKKNLDLGGYLASKGYEFAKLGEDGTPFFTNSDGEEKAFDVPKFLKSKGLNPANVSVTLNSMDEPLDESPVTIADRARLALGNTKGQIGYLKTKFEDVRLHPDNGLLVKDKGVWQRADKGGMDPWELTKDVVEGAVSLVPSVAASTFGATKGLAAGSAAGPAGAVVGTIVGAGLGGGAAEGVRTSLGRMAGTYDATPEDQMKDIGWEIALNAGGQSVALAAKPTMALFREGFKKIGASPQASKDVLADVIGRTTGAGPVNTMTMFDQTDDVVKAIGSAKQGAGSTNDVLLNLRLGQLDDVRTMVAEAPKALTRRYGELIDDLAGSIDAKFTTSIGDVVKTAQTSLAESGYGKFVDGANNKQVFELLSNKESLSRIMAGAEGQALDGKTMLAMKRMNKALNEYSELGTANGPNAARALLGLKKAINQTAENLASDNAPATMQKFVGDIRKAVTNSVSAEFHRAGMTEKYTSLSNLYSKYGAAVDLARRTLKSENGEEVLLNKLVQGIGSNQTYKDLAGDMASLLGKSGADRLKNIQVREAAKAFTPVLPKLTFGSLAAGGIAAGTATHAPAVGATAAAIASPRGVLKATQYMGQTKAFLQSLPAGQRAQWLLNPQAVQATFRAALEAADGEDQALQQLLTESGIE